MRQKRDIRVVVQGDETVDVIPYLQACGVFPLELGSAVPDDLQKEESKRQNHGDVAAVHELAETGNEEHGFDSAEYQQHQIGKKPLIPKITQIDAQQECGHQHGDRDGKPVGRFHPRSGPEVQHHQAAADPEHAVDGTDVELTLGVGGIADFQMGQKIEQNGLGDQRIRPGDESLGRDDRRRGAEDDREWPQQLGQHEKDPRPGRARRFPDSE